MQCDYVLPCSTCIHNTYLHRAHYEKKLYLKTKMQWNCKCTFHNCMLWLSWTNCFLSVLQYWLHSNFSGKGGLSLANMKSVPPAKLLSPYLQISLYPWLPSGECSWHLYSHSFACSPISQGIQTERDKQSG